MKSVLLKFLSTISSYGMIDDGDNVLAAVSGGPDSVCMLHLIVRFQRKLGIDAVRVAHVNYGKRGRDSDLDQELVEEIAGNLGLDLFVKKVSPGYFNRVRKENFQKVARDVRYRFFREVAEKTGSDRISVAHTMDDQAETILMRVLAGQGLKGLKGIPPKSAGDVIRPLIAMKKHDIIDFLKSESIPFRVDRTNFGLDFERNRIRNEIFPLLDKYTGRDVKVKICDTGSIFRQLDDLVESITGKAMKESFSPDDYTLNLRKYRSYPELIRKSLIQKIGYIYLGKELNTRVIERADELLLREVPSFTMNFPGGFILRKSYEKAIFSTQKEPDPGVFHLTIHGPGEFTIGKGKGKIKVSHERISDIEPILEMLIRDRNLSAFSVVEDFFPLEVRNIREGDRIVPFGMRNRKKLKKIFIERKVAREERKSIPVIFRGSSILWVPGVIRSADLPIDSKSSEIIVLEYKRK